MDEQMKAFIIDLMKAYQHHTMQVRWCQRCEEPRTDYDFQHGAPVCNHCLATMPEEEIRWLAHAVQNKGQGMNDKGKLM